MCKTCFQHTSYGLKPIYSTRKLKEIEKIDKQLLDETAKFESAIEKIALQVFNTKIRPYLDKHNLTFLSGNGTWYVYPKNNFHEWDTKEYLPERIRNYLEINILDTHYNLFMFIPNYNE
jgi:hypothetical protein